jgi:Ca-activated chloride channel family protein
VNFENPRVFGALLLLVPLALLMAVHYWRRRRVPLFFGKGRRGGAGKIRFRYWAASLAFLAFFALALIALAGPRWGIRLVPEFRRGLDVVLAFDLSRSMDVRDGPAGTSRLEQAAAIASGLVSAPESAGVRFAAAAGKGRGVLAVPLTLDTEALSGFLGGIATSRITGRGTDLEKLIDAAALAFKDDFPGKRRIVLFSDGEALSGSLAGACDRCLARDIAVIAVGVGTEEGGLVPRAETFPGIDPAAGEPDGQGIVSRADHEALRMAAGRTGGAYIDGNTGAAATLPAMLPATLPATLLAEHLARDGESGPQKAAEPHSGETGFRGEPKSRRYLFILAALAFLGLSKFLACEFRLPRGQTSLPKKAGPPRV